jgi:hypothetical protein
MGIVGQGEPWFPLQQRIDLKCGPNILREVFAGLLFSPPVARQQAAKVSALCEVSAPGISLLQNLYRLSLLQKSAVVIPAKAAIQCL